MTIIVLILCLIALTGLLATVLARFIRSTPLVVIASAILAELLTALLDAYMESWPKVGEVVYQVIWSAWLTLPVILASSIGFVLLSRKFCKHDTSAS